MTIVKLNPDEKIETGDTIKHLPSGEEWIVAYEKNGTVCCCGWPESFANTHQCVLIEKATQDERKKILESMYKLGASDSRGRYARSILG